MVPVGDKARTRRRAVAGGSIRMQAETLARCLRGGHEKGDVLGVARIAGIMAAKRTAELIPLCHPLQLSSVELQFTPDPGTNQIHCQCQVQAEDRTGVEMEALTAVQIALLTVYDMCKAVDRGMVLSDIRLLEKQGGKSGTWVRDDSQDQRRGSS